MTELTATERETLVRATARTSGFCEDRVYPAVEAILTARLARLTDVHWRYFDEEGKPGFDDTTPEPEDVWRYDRDFRAALAAPTPTDDVVHRKPPPPPTPEQLAYLRAAQPTEDQA